MFGLLIGRDNVWKINGIKSHLKKNQKLKFLYRKNWFLTSELQRSLCYGIIQPDFDYACSAWYPNLTQKLNSLLSSIGQNVYNIP